MLRVERDLRERDGSGGRDFLRLPTEPHQELCCGGQDSFGRPTEPAGVDEFGLVQTSRENVHDGLSICDESFVGRSAEEERKSLSEYGWLSL